MRVLLTVGSLGGGGAERVISWLANSLAAEGHSVWLLTQRDSTHDFYSLSPVVTRLAVGEYRYLDSSKVSVVVNRLRLYRAIRTTALNQSMDVVLSFIDRLNLDVLTALVVTGVPVVVAERTDPAFSVLHPFLRRVRPAMYRHLAKVVVVQREVTAERLRQEWRLPAVTAIPNAVLVTPPKGYENAAREQLVLTVGRLSSEKNHDILIAAWAAIADRFPGWRLRIVGEGPLRRDLQTQVQDLGLAGSVELPGASAHVEHEYHRAAIFALPSRFEGFPNALLEAMASGCAPIASSSAGASVDLIQDGHNGLLVPSNDVSILANALESLMSNSVHRAVIACHAQRTVMQYSPNLIFPAWRSVLMDAAGLGADVSRERSPQG